MSILHKYSKLFGEFTYPHNNKPKQTSDLNLSDKIQQIMASRVFIKTIALLGELDQLHLSNIKTDHLLLQVYFLALCYPTQQLQHCTCHRNKQHSLSILQVTQMILTSTSSFQLNIHGLQSELERRWKEHSCSSCTPQKTTNAGISLLKHSNIKLTQQYRCHLQSQNICVRFRLRVSHSLTRK